MTRPPNPTDAPAPPERADPARLSPRQLEVLALIAQGRTDREIAVSLSLTRPTVSNHVARLLRKMGAPNRTAAAVLAVQTGLLALSSDRIAGVPPEN